MLFGRVRQRYGFVKAYFGHPNLIEHMYNIIILTCSPGTCQINLYGNIL